MHTTTSNPVQTRRQQLPTASNDRPENRSWAAPPGAAHLRHS